MNARPTGKVLISLFFLILAFFSRGQAQETASPTGSNRAALEDSLQLLVDGSPVFSKIFTGFYLIDPESEDVLYEKDAAKYFTPASNTKIFTFYTALQVLGDSLNVLRYLRTGDSTVIWGTANPLVFHPDIPHDSTVYDRMRALPGSLFFSDFNYSDDPYGPGWSWADFQYAYQAERSPFPMYGNLVRFKRDSTQNALQVFPEYFRNRLDYDPEIDNRRPRIMRKQHENDYTYNLAALMGMDFEVYKTFTISPELTSRLLEGELNRPVGVAEPSLRWLPAIQALKIPTPDTLYRRLMKDSDNFIAEQLLLMVSDKLFGIQNTDLAIDYASATLFEDAPDELVWRDGSGLSRYNLFTPRTVAHVLRLLYRALPEERLFDIFPAGGRSGTIESWYAGPDGEPFVFAKTGTLSNKHCLSGYLRCESGKTLIFSFMHNNYISSSNVLKSEMEKVLDFIRRKL